VEKDDRLIFLLSRAQHCLRTHMKQEFDNENLGVTPVQAGILFLLRREPRTMTDISRELSIDNSATTGLVDRLEKAGLAARRPHPGDRRTFLIEITDSGSEALEKAHTVVRKVNSRIKEGFSDQEMDVFRKVVNTVFTRFRKE
jgi:DNA-binding MarR family transcriptional regulator